MQDTHTICMKVAHKSQYVWKVNFTVCRIQITHCLLTNSDIADVFILYNTNITHCVFSGAAFYDGSFENNG